MPCALEALTVIKTSVIGQLFSSCEKTGEMQKTECPLQIRKTTNKPNKQQTTHHPETKKTSNDLSEIVQLRFQNYKNPWSTHVAHCSKRSLHTSQPLKR